jgi:tRNA dimethylallyltransferase
MKQPMVLCLAGPTATGKSSAAIELAERLGAEIISVDSMQVYRGMNIGTAKPSASDQARVCHHLIDIVDPDHRFDAAQFAQLAQEALQNVLSRGRNAIFCGGTGLYFKAFFSGLGQSPPSNPQLRADLEKAPLAELLTELQERDPATFQTIDRQNPRRIVRALEVIRLTGHPFSELRTPWPKQEQIARTADSAVSEPGVSFFGLLRSREDLRRRIDARVDWMFAHGLLDETEALRARGLAENPTARQALGYRQVLEHLEGARNLDDTIALVKTRTRQYAKRQITWFRRQARLEWIELEAAATPSDAADRIASSHRGRDTTWHCS